MMNPFSSLRVALDALLVNKGRTCLTSLGIVVGITAVIALVAAGDGARAKLDERLASVGKNLVMVRPGARTNQGMVADFTPLTRADADAIRKQVMPLLVGVAETQQILRVVSTPTAHIATSVCGTVPELQQVRLWTLRRGRFLTDEDVRRQSAVCVIGETIREKLFPQGDALGQTVRIDRQQLRVVGVLAPKGRSPTGADQDEQVFVPLTTLQQRLAGEERLSAIMTAARDEGMIERAKQEISRVLREKLRQKPGSESFDVSSVHEIAELALVVTNTLKLLVAVIASISLLVGGIGIMNIMLVSVTERTREIGLRMAVGATPGDVLFQFLIESAVLALVGGLVGVALGCGAAVGLASLANWPVILSPMVVAVACGVSAAVGLFFGYYPAWRASRLDPIDALRHE